MSTAVWISRVRVTGGFLSGLDVELRRGLNVVIGARGAGKTTFLELLRHAAGAEHADQRQDTKRQEFLNAVLGSGEVIVDVHSEDGDWRLVADKSGPSQVTDMSSEMLVLGQNELGEIASDATNRLRLLDLRTGPWSPPQRPASEEVAELTTSLFMLRSQLDALHSHSLQRERLELDEEMLISQQASLLSEADSTVTDSRARLEKIEQQLLMAREDISRLDRANDLAEKTLAAGRNQADLAAQLRESLVSESYADLARDHFDRARSFHEQSDAAFTEALEAIRLARDEATARHVNARETAAPLRSSLESAESGLGHLSNQLRLVRDELGTLDANDLVAADLLNRVNAAVDRRRELTVQTESLSEELYQRRSAIASEVTSELGSNVVITVDHLGDTSGFTETLADLMKGSGIRAAVFAALSSTVLPSQLRDLIESRDVASLSAISGISMENAERVVSNLFDVDKLRALAEVELVDSADFILVDGPTRKSVDELSTGQKCAVTLPIVLSERRRVLLLDQPEDHLDNAYLVRNIVLALDMRTSDSPWVLRGSG